MEDPRVCSGVIDGVFTYLQMTLVILYPLAGLLLLSSLLFSSWYCPPPQVNACDGSDNVIVYPILFQELWKVAYLEWSYFQSCSFLVCM